MPFDSLSIITHQSSRDDAFALCGAQNVDSKQQSSEMDRLRSELNARQMQMMALQEQLQAAEDRARNAEHIGVKLKTDLEAFRTQVSDAKNRSAEGERKLETFRAAQGELVRSLIGKILCAHLLSTPLLHYFLISPVSLVLFALVPIRPA